MRNQLTPRASSIPDVVYAAEGQLDGHAFSLTAWGRSRLTLDFGPCNLSLTTAAMIELINHLAKAMDKIVETQASEQEVHQ